jgi:hypothetical protein
MNSRYSASHLLARDRERFGTRHSPEAIGLGSGGADFPRDRANTQSNSRTTRNSGEFRYCADSRAGWKTRSTTGEEFIKNYLTDVKNLQICLYARKGYDGPIVHLLTSVLWSLPCTNAEILHGVSR